MIQGSAKCAERRISSHKYYLVFEAEPGTPWGVLDLWFLQDINQRKCVDFLWGLEGYSWLEWERYFCTPSPQAASQYLAVTKHHHKPGWREVKSLQRWHRHLSQNFRSVTSQSASKQSKHQNFKTSDSTRDDKECQRPHKRTFLCRSYKRRVQIRFIDNITTVYL